MANYHEAVELDRVYLALADASRRHIVAQLAERGELSVGEASDGLALSPAGVTKHVRMLQDAGLVTRRLDGRRHLLSLESHRLLLAEDWIDRYRVMWTQSLHRLASLAEHLETLPEPTRSPGLDPTHHGDTR